MPAINTGSQKHKRLCSWHDPRQCQERATHYHHIYGTICGYHAKTIELRHPQPGERCKLLKGPLLQKLYPNHEH